MEIAVRMTIRKSRDRAKPSCTTYTIAGSGLWGTNCTVRQGLGPGTIVSSSGRNRCRVKGPTRTPQTECFLECFERVAFYIIFPNLKPR